MGKGIKTIELSLGMKTCRNIADVILPSVAEIVCVADDDSNDTTGCLPSGSLAQRNTIIH